MIKKRVLITTLCISAAALVSACLLGKNTGYTDRITAEGETGTLTFEHSGMTFKDNTSADCVATTKSGFPITAKMTITYNSLSSYFCVDYDDEIYRGTYFSDDDRYEDGYSFDFEVKLTNVGKVSKENVLVNVGDKGTKYDIYQYVSVIETTPFPGQYLQTVKFKYSNTLGTKSDFWINNIQITYPCK